MGAKSFISGSIAAFALTCLPSVGSAVSSTRISVGNGRFVGITAQSLFRNSETQTIQLTGNVQVNFEGEVLRCDTATVDEKAKTIVAQGNLVIASPSAYVEGRMAEVSYDTSQGVIYDGFVKSGQVLFEGRLIRKTGTNDYVAEQAKYTACTTCPPAWSFRGTEIEAEIGGYAFIRSAKFEIGGVTVFWLPYLIVPLKSERQTGILIPAYEITGENFVIGLPFFWAISRNQDMTLTPKFYTQRGWKGLVNYRYMFSDESYGESNFGAFLLKDRQFSSESDLATRPGSERSGRWFFNHEHTYNLPGGFINKARLNFVSDLRYPFDFPEDILGRGDSSLENVVSLTKNTETTHSSIEASYYINQLKTDPLDGNADSVHRFPEIRQSGVDRSLFGSRSFLRWDINYVNFAREDFAYDDVVGTGSSKSIDRTRGSGGSGSGVFQPGTDLIRTGQRVDFKPEISVPFRIGPYFDVLPSVQIRHTQYSFNVTPPAGSGFEVFPYRQYVRGRLALRTQLSRVYDLARETNENEIDESTEPRDGIFSSFQPPPKPVRPEKLKHEIEPEIAISSIPWLQQTASEFFGDNSRTPIFLNDQPVSNADFNSTKGLQFDYDDRITQRNTVSFLVNNRFVKKTWSDDTANYRQIVSIKNGTSYEFDKRDKDPSYNFSDIYSVVDVRLDRFETNTVVRYFPYHRVFNSSSRVLFRDIKGNFLQLNFAQNFLITENVNEAYPNRVENIGFTVGFTHRYATVATTFDYLINDYWPLPKTDLRVKSWSVLMDLKPPGDCWGVRFNLGYAIGDPAIRYNFSFNYNFGGAI